MLSLTRRSEESILIGENIWVKIGRLQGNRVQLLIDAPRDVRVLRGELVKPPGGLTTEEAKDNGAPF